MVSEPQTGLSVNANFHPNRSAIRRFAAQFFGRKKIELPIFCPAPAALVLKASVLSRTPTLDDMAFHPDA
jgi:hypothetical protein